MEPWVEAVDAATYIVRWRGQPCEAGRQCHYQGRPIVVGYDVKGIPVWHSETGLISTPDGWRHTGCPDPRLNPQTHSSP